MDLDHLAVREGRPWVFELVVGGLVTDAFCALLGSTSLLLPP